MGNHGLISLLFLHGFVMVYCVKLWPLQRVVIIRFVADREAPEKIENITQKRFLPLTLLSLSVS